MEKNIPRCHMHLYIEILLQCMFNKTDLACGVLDYISQTFDFYETKIH